MLQAVLLCRHQQPKGELGKDMGIGRFREETGTSQLSSLSRSWLIKGNHMVPPAPLVLEPHPVLPFHGAPPALTNPIFCTDLTHILQSYIPQPASPPDLGPPSQLSSEIPNH